jgi:hypothetical protein
MPTRSRYDPRPWTPDDLISTPVSRLPHLSPVDRSRLLVPLCDYVRAGPFGPLSPQELGVVGCVGQAQHDAFVAAPGPARVWIQGDGNVPQTGCDRCPC